MYCRHFAILGGIDKAGNNTYSFLITGNLFQDNFVYSKDIIGLVSKATNLKNLSRNYRTKFLRILTKGKRYLKRHTNQHLSIVYV